ncbi:hypothetical protein BJ878DRAFT_518110 [Calycina marina]|uniref:G-patch domain-containing protein n=1 Tax=Calycina marina TaxID=1763456 RepID=A0A9P8CCH3_9HELO|nr:hypothetical protein BJ878DRAFT_518110 [Calycina marina]
MSDPLNQAPPQRSTGLSLYANLLDVGATPGSISKGPVLKRAEQAQEEAAAKKHQIDAAALRFQPTKRPQLAQKPKPKASHPKSTSTENVSKAPAPPINTTRPSVKSKLADWTVDDDVNGFYGGTPGEKRQRGGRKRRKKNKEDFVVAQDWDDIYDPTRPNSYEEYKNSDEKVREFTEWKDVLYAHRKARKPISDLGSDEEEYSLQMNNKFAPPAAFSFAPPPIDVPSKPAAAAETPESEPYSSTLEPIPIPPPPPLSKSPPLPPQAPVMAASIARAPVRYNLPAPPSDIPSSEAELAQALATEEPSDGESREENEKPKSSRPGQQGFAERLMSKYGWSKGKGLGADGSGITTALRVQLEKRKKKSDAEGGGFRDPGGRGKIVGGQKVAKKDEEGKFGDMSEVIVLRGMVDGMDLDTEVEGAGDGGLMQEIGDECAEKYGRVDRVYIDKHGTGPAKVFVKFTSQLSGLRAVNALEGRIFNGNTISALFYDADKFEEGIYE